VRFMPPLVIASDEVDEALVILEASLNEARAALSSGGQRP
jgi:4-aminobutyrate aminotransferase-like enzyme